MPLVAATARRRRLVSPTTRAAAAAPPWDRRRSARRGRSTGCRTASRAASPRCGASRRGPRETPAGPGAEAVAGVHHEVRAEHHAGVALEQQRVVRPFGAGRAHGDEAAGEHVAVRVAAVGLLVGGRGVLRQPHVEAELGAIPPRRPLMALGGQHDVRRTRQRRHRVRLQAHRVDEHAAIAGHERVRTRDVAADAAVVDAPVIKALGDLFDLCGRLPWLAHLSSCSSDVLAPAQIEPSRICWSSVRRQTPSRMHPTAC